MKKTSIELGQAGCPIEIVGVRYARNGAADMPLQRRPPRDQREPKQAFESLALTARPAG